MRTIILLLVIFWTTILSGQEVFSTMDIVNVTVTPKNGSSYTLYPRGTVDMDGNLRYVEINNGANYNKIRIELSEATVQMDNSIMYYYGEGKYKSDYYTWMLELPTLSGDYYLYLEENMNTTIVYKLKARSVTRYWE